MARPSIGLIMIAFTRKGSQVQVLQRAPSFKTSVTLIYPALYRYSRKSFPTVVPTPVLTVYLTQRDTRGSSKGFSDTEDRYALRRLPRREEGPLEEPEDRIRIGFGFHARSVCLQDFHAELLLADSEKHGHAGEKRPSVTVLRSRDAQASAVAKLINLVENVDAIEAQLDLADSNCA